MIYQFIIIYKMFQFMDESFILTVRLFKLTGYNYNITGCNYNITVKTVYNNKQSICYICRNKS